MASLLSFEQAPPISAPLRFFLTAPLFAILAGCLLLWSGPDLYTSRWTPQALALTHLVTAGFMMQVMLGALQQLLPVMAGANIAHPRQVAAVVHLAITLGALGLVAAFLGGVPWLFGGGVVCMAIGVGTFVLAAVRALYGVPTTSPVIHGLRMALVGLGVTVSIGLLLAVSLGWPLGLPLERLANVHLGWGFVGWGCATLGAVGFVAVPMFQQTPPYPAWFGRNFAYTTLGVIVLWTVAELAGWALAARGMSVAVVLIAAAFALITLNLQHRSKRPTRDAVQRLWQMAMFSALVACTLWLVAQLSPLLEAWPRWPLLFGTLLLFGGFMSVIVGMLYKIVPFLVWLHLQNRGRGRLAAPNMKKVLAERQINGQAWAHGGAFVLLLLAAIWPPVFVYPAGIGLIVANLWLLRNLLAAMGVYRDHLAKIQASPDKAAKL